MKLYMFRQTLQHKRVEHQQRIGLCRMIAELHNQRLLQTPILFDTLYFILDCGHFGKRHGADLDEGAANGLQKVDEADEEEEDEEEEAKESPAETNRLEEKPSLYYRFAKSAGRSRGNGYDPLVPSRMDPPSSQARIILACTMLNASKDFFAKGAFRAQLDRYLIHLQRYALAKRSLHQLPHAEFLLMDV